MARSRGPTPADLWVGARFLSSLPFFLREPVYPKKARADLRQRLERRADDFLTLVRSAVYENPPSPYYQLLALAGCEYEDLEQLVRQEGLEGALGRLYRQGVYLTVEELKGRRSARRGSASITVSPGQLRIPTSRAHFITHSSGSRSPQVPLLIDLASLRVQAGNHYLELEARQGLGWTHAQWGAPGSSVLGRMIGYGLTGIRQVRWFTPVDPGEAGLHPRYIWSARIMRWGSLLAGRPLPGPEYVPLDDPLPIARWLAETLGNGATPHIFGFPSSAVRLCRAALAAGIDVSGAQFTLFGEPITGARLNAIRRAGAVAMPRYGSTESGIVGYGCLAAAAPDDQHLPSDMHALIQTGPGPHPSGLPPSALLVSSLRPTARLLLINVSLGDQATLTQRKCGCPLEELGWTTHLHSISSFEKLSACGAAILDTDVIRVMEEVLPTRFGGGPTDYQLVEAEAEDGQPCLLLLVHPAIGPLDHDEVAEAFLSTIGAGCGVERLVELQWRQAGLPRVVRAVPRSTLTGKIHHLHQERRPLAV